MRGIGILIFLFTCTWLGAQDKVELSYNEYYYLEATFENIPNKDDLINLEAQNIELTSYLGNKRYKLVVPKKVDLGTLSEYGILTYSQQKENNKISKRIIESGIPSHAKKGLNLEVAIVLNKSLTENKLNVFISEMGLNVNAIFSKGQIIRAETDQATIERLTAHPLVSFVNFVTPELKPLNHEVSALLGAKYLNSVVHGQGLEGKGVVVGVGDGGTLGDHIDNNGFHINEADGTYSSYGSHGDHVSGTIAGRGLLNPRHKGIAPQSTLVVQKTQNIIYNAEDYYEQYNMVLTNNSYGVTFDCEFNGAYNYTSLNLDKQLRETPQLMHLFAAGNNGANVCGDFPQGFNTVLKFYGAAKNVLTVGAVDEEKKLSSMSAKGPVADGRVKPEIVGVGVNVVSTGRNNDYFTSSGTSMATPSVTGCMSLMYEKYEQVNGKQAYGDLMKAIICNTAEDLGNYGPDYEYGFGLANLVNAVACIEDENYFVDEIYNGEEIVNEINVPSGLSELKIMNYWHDHESEAYPTIALINNLDLVVEDPNGQKFYPLVLNSDPNKVDDPAKQGIDNLNNIEQVTIKNPIPGVYKLFVKGKSVPFGGQRFNLVYDFLEDDLQLVYPVGKECFTPGQEYPISWVDYGSTNNSYNVDFSIDGGQTWHPIAEKVSSINSNIFWEVPETSTTTGFVRVERVGSSSKNILPFNIFEKPKNLIATPLCQDIVKLSWDKPSQINSFEVFQYVDGQMLSKGTTESERFEIENSFEINQTYWFAIQGIHSSGQRTERTIAVPVIFEEMNSCPRENDIKLMRLFGIKTGRAHTSASLSDSETLRMQIKNIGREDMSQIKFHVRLNDEDEFADDFDSMLYSGMELNYPFGYEFDLTNDGNYKFDAWISSNEDLYFENDSLIGTFSVKQLSNDPIELPYSESFNNSGLFSIQESTIGLMDLEKWDYINGGSELNSISSELNGGNHSIKLNNFENSTTQTIITLNTTSFSMDQQILMNFKYKLDQVDDFDAHVYMRGNDLNDWILVANLGQAEDWKKINNYNITSGLRNNDQLYSTSTQIKFVLIGEGEMSLDDLEFENIPLSTEDLLQEDLEVYPNPFTNNINVSLRNEFAGQVDFKLFDAAGNQKMSQSKELEEGLSIFNFDLEKALPAGIYFLKIQMGAHQIIRKVSKHLN